MSTGSTALLAEIAALRAQVAEMREALEPFAALYTSSAPFNVAAFKDGDSWPANFEQIADLMMVGHLRRAASVLATTSMEDKT